MIIGENKYATSFDPKEAAPNFDSRKIKNSNQRNWGDW